MMMTMMGSLAAALALGLAGNAPPPSLARSFATAAECANTAKTLYDDAGDDDAGFALLSSCVARDDFRDLDALLSPPFVDAIRRRADGPALVAHVIGVRGGDIDRDLRSVRRAHLPIHSLRAAMADPDFLDGTLVVMRASVGESRRDRGRRAVELAEVRPATNDDIIDDAELFRRARVRPRDELSVETGLLVVANVPDAFFLEPSTDYVVLLRFEGAREQIIPGTGLTEDVSVATVLGTWEPYAQ